MTPLDLAVRNAAAFWTALAETRGNALTRRPGFLAVHGERGGMRVLLLSPNPTPGDLAELTELARSAEKVVVEDQFGTVDLTAAELIRRQLPVMIRKSTADEPWPATPDVRRVESVEQLETAEHIVVHGFTLPDFQPYQRGEVFPPELLRRPGVDLFLIDRDGVPAGAALTIIDEGDVGGVYWVTTLPEHRSKGVGRALMHAVLTHMAGRPLTLTAARAGRPLYDSLGFDVVTDAAWWVTA